MTPGKGKAVLLQSFFCEEAVSAASLEGEKCTCAQKDFFEETGKGI